MEIWNFGSFRLQNKSWKLCPPPSPPPPKWGGGGEQAVSFNHYDLSPPKTHCLSLSCSECQAPYHKCGLSNGKAASYYRPHPKGGLLYLHPIIFPLVPFPFWTSTPSPSHNTSTGPTYPILSWVYPIQFWSGRRNPIQSWWGGSPGQGYPQPRTRVPPGRDLRPVTGVPADKDMGYLRPSQDRMGYPCPQPEQDGVLLQGQGMFGQIMQRAVHLLLFPAGLSCLLYVFTSRSPKTARRRSREHKQLDYRICFPVLVILFTIKRPKSGSLSANNQVSKHVIVHTASLRTGTLLAWIFPSYISCNIYYGKVVHISL